MVTIYSYALTGLSAHRIEVQVHMAPGVPCFSIVGLADKAVSESKERVRAALTSLGLSLPPKRIIVNLAPADLHKEGSHYDLPIACGLLVALNIVPIESLSHMVVMGELGLDASTRKVKGVLPAAIEALAEGKGIICPADNGSEAMWAGAPTVIAPSQLLELIHHLQGKLTLPTPRVGDITATTSQEDMHDVYGQALAKRAFEIAAAGGHHVVMMGAPGVGKSMLAKRMHTILPPLTPKEMLETSMIRSVAGTLDGSHLSSTRPYRAPHHSCSMAAMVGGGVSRSIQPGEISLAHHGVLFLDELPEFQRPVLDALRQPLETGEVLISRASAHVTFPSQFQLIAAMNPCRCGYLYDPAQCCSQAPQCGATYQNRVSGPLWDRFDLWITVDNIPPRRMLAQPRGDYSAAIQHRVGMARNRQVSRYEGQPHRLNSQANSDMLQSPACMSDEALQLLHHAIEQWHLSMRSYVRLMRVARTIADLSEEPRILPSHMAEALSYRPTHARVTALHA